MKQYAASPIIQQLVADRREYFATGWGDQFYDTIWNVDTAEGIGLDIWGKIVGIGRNIKVTDPAGDYIYTLDDKGYRVLILAKAFANIVSTDSRSLNRVVNRLFPGRGRAWVNDLGSMAMRIVFEFALEPWEFVVISNGSVMPRPAGVGVKLAQIPADTFGFAEATDTEPFNQGTFLSTEAVTNVA